jgi:prepilin-type N-terminal cleavage/methylation domain-containing protein
MKRNGFTLIEIISCLAIVLVLAAITYPVIVSSRQSGLKTQTISNLRQLYIALELYRQEYDGAAIGDLNQLGLPPVDYYASNIAATLKPPLAGRYPGVGWYYLMPPDPANVQPEIVNRWRDYGGRCESGAILLVDVNFSDVPPVGGSPLLTSTGYGVRLSGSVEVRKARGSPLSFNWWGCSPKE